MEKCQCAGCTRYFNRLSIFDMHRLGEYKSNARRCMTEDEMRVAGLETERKMVQFLIDGKNHQSEQDVWFSPEKREAARKAFLGGTYTRETVLA